MAVVVSASTFIAQAVVPNLGCVPAQPLMLPQGSAQRVADPEDRALAWGSRV